MPVTLDEKALQSAVEEHFQENYEEKALELWVEIAKKHEVEYEIVEERGKRVAKPVNEQEAMMKNFGSGTRGVKATFWFEQAKKEFKERLGELND